MNRKRKSILILLISLIFFYLSTYPLFQILKKPFHQLPTEAILKKLPPELILTTILFGGFRGILVNFLWIRAMKLQDAGKFFELVQLSRWITLLQPYIPEIWVYKAWNLSYNISVRFPTDEERWNWVYAGIELLRDRALKYIPDSPLIYQELSWIYFNKISSPISEAHAYYKRRWAEIMRDALGDMKIEEIAAHLSYEELMKNEKVNSILKSFSEKGIDLFRDWEKISKDNFQGVPEELKKFLSDSDFKKIEAYMRAKILKENLKLCLATMLYLENKYFQFDWKSAPAHSLYWIEKGRKRTDMREIDYRRMVYFSLGHLLEWGRIDFRKIEGEEFLLVSPELAAIPILNKFYEETIREVAEEHLLIGVKSSHRNFLRNAIVLSYITNNLSLSHYYYQYLKDKYPGDVGKLSFSDFVAHHFIGRLREGSPSEISSLLFGILYQAYWSLAIGEDERSAGMESLARLIYTRVSAEDERFKDMFPTFDVLKTSVLEGVLETLPPLLSLSLKSRLKEEETPSVR